MVTSWHLKNICYAQQGLLCVPVCHNLDRKGEEAEMATAVPLLTYSNTFNIGQKVRNRQRTEKYRTIHSSATATLSLCAHTPKKNTFTALGLQCSEETRRCAESTVKKRKLWPSNDHLSGSRSTRSSIPHPLVLQISAERRCFTENLFLLCLLGIDRPPVVHPLLLTYLLMYHSRKQFFPSICSCLSVADTDQRIIEYNSFHRRLIGLTPLRLPFHTL